MKVNERGSTLVLVLIVILVFSILGVSIMGNAVNERKRVDLTEADGRARVLAQSGLNYFESQFKTYAKPDRVFTMNELKEYFEKYSAPDGNFSENVNLDMIWDDLNDIVVTSKGTEGSIEKSITGHYRLGFDIDKPTREIADFTAEGTQAVNFANESVLGLNLLNILGADLLQADLLSFGDDKTFYAVPDDDSILQVELGLLGLLKVADISFGEFTHYRDTNYIAVRKSSVLGLQLLGDKQKNAVALNLLDYEANKDINVLINGYTEYVNLLDLDGLFRLLNLLGLDRLLNLLGLNYVLGLLDSLTTIPDYKDIEFQKFAVFGNVLIQQNKGGILGIGNDNEGPRRFTFDDGLYVSRSIAIGGRQSSNSHLMLRGDMVARENLIISFADLIIGDRDEDGLAAEDKASNLYVHGDVHIKNASIQMKNDEYDFGILSKGKMTIENEKDTKGCGELNGLFYAKNGIDIKTNNKKIVINGGLIGDITVDGVLYDQSNREPIANGGYKMGNLEYYPKEEYMDKLKDVTLTLKESK